MNNKTTKMRRVSDNLNLLVRTPAFKWIALIAIIEIIFHALCYYGNRGWVAWVNLSGWTLWLAFWILLKRRSNRGIDGKPKGTG